MVEENITLTVDDFGSVEDHISKELKQVKRFTWKNSRTNVSVQVCCFKFQPRLIDDSAELVINLDLNLFISLRS